MATIPSLTSDASCTKRFKTPFDSGEPLQFSWRNPRAKEMLPTDKTSSKEVTVSLKCGLLRGQHLIGDFQFVTWSYNEQKPYLTYPGLATRIKNAFPNVTEPFNIVLIDEDNDHIVLPGDDMRETIAALNCFRHRYPAPLRVFLQLPAEPSIHKEETEKVIQAKVLDYEMLASSVTALAGAAEKFHETLKILNDKVEAICGTLCTFNEQVCTLAELIAKQKVPPAQVKNAETYPLGIHRVSDESIETASSPTDTPPSNSSAGHMRSDSSSESHYYDEDDWTPVEHGLGGTPRRRRRLTTTSSCASSEPLKEDIMQLMADEFDTVMMGFQRNP